MHERDSQSSKCLVSAAYGIHSAEFTAALLSQDNQCRVALSVPARSHSNSQPENSPKPAKGYLSLPVGYNGGMVALQPGARTQVANIQAWRDAWMACDDTDKRIARSNLDTLVRLVPKSESSTAAYLARVLGAVYELLDFRRDMCLLFAEPRTEVCASTSNESLHWISAVLDSYPMPCRPVGRGTLESTRVGGHLRVARVSGIYRFLQSSYLGTPTVVPWYCRCLPSREDLSVSVSGLLPTYWPRCDHAVPGGLGRHSRLVYDRFVASPEFLWTFADLPGLAAYFGRNVGGWSAGDRELFSAVAATAAYRRPETEGASQNHVQHLLSLCKEYDLPSVGPASQLGAQLADGISRCLKLRDVLSDPTHHRRRSRVRLRFKSEQAELSMGVRHAMRIIAGKLRTNAVSLAVSVEPDALKERLRDLAVAVMPSAAWVPIARFTTNQGSIDT